MSFISIDCGSFDSRPLIADGKPKRVRPRKATTQIQDLLNASHALDKEPTNDLTIARMKFLQARLAVLTKMQQRERTEKLKRAVAEVTRLTTENQKLKVELAAALTKTRPKTEAEIVLERYDLERAQRGGAQ